MGQLKKKILNCENRYSKEEFANEREIQVMSLANHPNIISLHNAHYFKNKVYLAMELCAHSLSTEF